MSDNKPITPIRGDSVAISYETRKGLRYVARARGIITDALAEEVLWNWLEQSHPDVAKRIKDAETSEASFEQELKSKIGPKIPFAD